MPPDDRDLVKTFLKNQNFLLLSNNWYNSLGLGLTQLHNATSVYNTKRYEKVKLCGRTFEFKRPNNGFPNKLSPEFLLVDLMNNIDSLGESTETLKTKIISKVEQFDQEQLTKLAVKYGKVGTKKFFLDVLGKMC